MNVKLIRMWSGEDVIADLIKETDDFIIIQNPIFAVPQGDGQVGFAPWSPLLKARETQLEIVKRYIVYISETQDEVVDQYNQMFAPIATPPRKKLIL
tara:strand:+ start:603 stop:893 length:291 start_codon:yes stop_codon:yes gene_type:complete